jgi:hypothetical protein
MHVLVLTLWQGFWPTASTVLSAMANYDHFTGSTTYKTQVTNAINKAFSLYTNFDEVGLFLAIRGIVF